MPSNRGALGRLSRCTLWVATLLTLTGYAAADGVRVTTAELGGLGGNKFTLTVIDPSLYANAPVQAELRLLDERNVSVASLDGLLQPRQALRLHYTVPTAGSARLHAVVTLRVSTGRLVTPVALLERASETHNPALGPDDIKAVVCPMHTPPVPPPNDGPVTDQGTPDTAGTLTTPTSTSPAAGSGAGTVIALPPLPPPGGGCSSCRVERIP